MKQKLLSVFVILIASLQFAYSQRTISGTVTSAKDKQPVIGAVVLAEKTAIGTTTDIDGKYSLQVPDNTTNLVISYTGMKSKTVAITGTVMDIALEENEKQLDDVVVTALGVKREKKALGYATQEVKGDDVNTSKDANLINNLTGKVAGIQISGNSNIGGSSRITIRGIKSLTGNNQPLFVIDGIVVDNSNYSTTDVDRGAQGYDYGNAISDLNADDIETINVLKGGPATALYGNRGINGVILITTKKGHKQTGEKGKSPIGVTVTENMMFNQVYALPQYQNEYGGGYGPSFVPDETDPTQQRVRLEDDASWGPKIDGRLVRQYASYNPTDPTYGKATPYIAHPNNVKDFFETGYMANTNVAMDGANDKGSFRASFSNLTQKGTVPNSNLRRNTISFNGSYNFTDKIFANVNATYVHNEGTGRPQVGYNSIFSNFTQWFQRQLDIKDLRNYKNPDGTQRAWNLAPNYDDNGNFLGTYSPYFWDNPYWRQYENYENDHRDRVFGVAELGWKLTSWLTAKGKFTTDFYNEIREERVAVGAATASGSTPGYSLEQIAVMENNYEGTLTAQKAFRDIFDISAMIGLNRRDQNSRDNISATQGGLNIPGWYMLENSKDKIAVNNFRSQKRVNSVFGALSLGFKHLVYIDVTMRNDWASSLYSPTVPTNKMSFFYPSVSGSFVFSELLKSKKVLSFGKIRGGWTVAQNDPSPYKTSTLPGVGPSFGSLPMYVVPNTYNNPNLKPEKVTSWEVGLELGFIQDRVHIDATYYHTVTRDNIFTVEETGAAGNTFRYTNAGTMQNQGVELATTFVPVRTKSGFEWSVGFNWAKNYNLVKELYKDAGGNEVTSLNLGTAPFAATLEARPGMAYGQIVATDFVYDSHGNKIVGPDGQYLVSPNVKPLGSILPDFTGGVSTTLSYKGLSLYALFDFQKGGKLFSITNMWGQYDGTLAITAANNVRETGLIVPGVKQALDGAGNPILDSKGNPTSDGTPNDVRVSAIDYYQNGTGNGYFGPARQNVYDASFVKFRELRLMYQLPSKLFQNTPIKGVSIGIIGRNLAILKKNVPNVDPEAATNAGNVQGFEGGTKPTERSIGFSASVKF
ncbi:MAG: SusC/RagA family TonB-linked outer membrane protein [Bacteroidetes bacterium]|nr:SusC/RagA family TonB-linked outer membrane protein [Bacteroidota bacterium]